MITAALAIVLAIHRDQASDLLDEAVAQPPDLIKAQISTQCRFIADGYEFGDEFKTDVMGRRKTNMTALEQLIARGPDVVPYLTSQLGRKDPTKFTIQGSPDIKAVAYEFYDPKVRQPDVDYWDVVTMEQVNKAEQLVQTVTRGDLAYFALGQIVNRWYGIYFPGKITLFCSASDHPEIQKQAAADWGNLNPTEFEKILRNDVRKPDTYARMTFGFTRYRNYFPGDASELAVQTLRNTYGQFPQGKPDIAPNNFWAQMEPIANKDLDQVAYQQLTRTDKENGFLAEYDTTQYQILLYLKNRKGYEAIAINYAKDFVKKKKDKYGYFARFLQRYGK